MFKKFLSVFKKTPEPKIIELPPRASFKVHCKIMNVKAYCGMDLNNPQGNSAGIMTCPCCGKVYKMRVRHTDEVSHHYVLGRNHTFALTKIKLEKTFEEK